MREWFIVGSKLLGVFLLYNAVASLLGSIGLIVSVVGSRDSFIGSSVTGMFLFTSFSIAATICFAYFLIFKTELLADKFKLTDRLQDSPCSHARGKLQPGIILIGIYIFCTRIGSLAHAIANNLRDNNMVAAFAAAQPKGLTFSIDYIAPVVTLLFSLFLIFGSGNIAAFLENRTMAGAAQSE